MKYTTTKFAHAGETVTVTPETGSPIAGIVHQSNPDGHMLVKLVGNAHHVWVQGPPAPVAAEEMADYTAEMDRLREALSTAYKEKSKLVSENAKLTEQISALQAVLAQKTPAPEAPPVSAEKADTPAAESAPADSAAPAKAARKAG